jgi:hypothetical protein
MSPALDNSQVRDRGRRRTRARAKIANDAGANGCRNENDGDGWIVSGIGEDRAVAQDDLVQGTEEEEPEPDVSPTLADAILKRPDSIKLRKPSTTKGQHQPSTVFKSAPLINNEKRGSEKGVNVEGLDIGGRGGTTRDGDVVPDNQPQDGRLDDTSPLSRVVIPTAIFETDHFTE